MTARGEPWLISRRFDLSVFVAPALIALALVPMGGWWSEAGDTPIWAWLIFVVFIDVAHVWSTLYRTYLDPAELARRPALYLGAPILAYAAGVSLASISTDAFWRGIAYLAVFHFVRQQYGWMRLYGGRDSAATQVDRWLDGLAIYAATVVPLLWWHTHLPRRFVWFVPTDFVPHLTGLWSDGIWLVYGGLLAAFGLRQVQRWREEGWAPWGKIWMVATTSACWGVGIVATNSDWAFTVTNVIIHGVPYMAFLWVYGRRAHGGEGQRGWLAYVFRGGRWLHFLALLFALAYFEEYLWDRSLWHERGDVFAGPEWTLPGSWVVWWMPLLAVPQVTHYILDGFIWKMRKDANPELSSVMREARSAPGAGG